jgi:hypothetical protein
MPNYQPFGELAGEDAGEDVRVFSPMTTGLRECWSMAGAKVSPALMVEPLVRS